MYIYIHIYVYVYIHICVYVYISIHTHMYIYIHVYINMYVCMYVCMYMYMYIYICVCIYIYIYILFSSFKLLFCFPTDWNIQELQKHCISQCFFQPSNIKILPRSGIDLQVIFPHMIFSELPSKQIYVLTHPATKPLLALSKEFVYWVLLKLDFVNHAFCKIMTKNICFEFEFEFEL